MSPSFNLQAHRDPQPTVRFCLTASAALPGPGGGRGGQRRSGDLAGVQGGEEECVCGGRGGSREI